MTRRAATTRIFVHHTVTPRSSSDKYYQGDVCERIRKLHLARGFSDIGYHYIVTGEGRILLGRDVREIGAHVQGSNFDSIGVSCLGTFTVGGDVMVVGDAQYSALCDILAYLCRRYSLHPRQIFGHRDAQKTECPGTIYGLLDHIRASVFARMQLPESAPPCARQ